MADFVFVYWVGPRAGDIDMLGRLVRALPPERWPFCEPSEHESCCLLRVRSTGFVAPIGSFCDCDASDEGSTL